MNSKNNNKSGDLVTKRRADAPRVISKLNHWCIQSTKFIQF